jgi:hypothetical protein
MKKISTLLCLLAAFAPGLAHSYGAAGTVAAPYLELPMGARGEGMGEAFTAVADDVNSIYYNPAGLTSLDVAQIELMHVDSFGGVEYENVGIAVPTDLLGVNMWSTLALSYTLVGIDDTPLTEESSTGQYISTPYTFTAGASVLTLSYAWQATQLLSVGATIKTITEKIASAQGTGLAGDVGVLTRQGQFGGFSAGATLENFGTSPEPDSTLPTDLRMGLGYDFAELFGPMDPEDKLLLDADFVTPVVPVDEEWQLNIGGEYTRSFGKEDGILRLGYRFPPETELGSGSGLSLGGGLATHLTGMDLSLDYAWIPYGELGDQQRIALSIEFGDHTRAQAEGPRGDYLYPPKNVAVSGGDHSARLTWDPQTGTVDGYNIYMSYNPDAKEWTRLNKSPVTSTSMSVKNLYNGYKVYFCVSTLARKSANLYRESDKSAPVVVIPR